MRKLLDKKGIGIELAIVMLVVVFTMCALIFSLSYVSVFKSRSEISRRNVKIEVERIGEDFLEGALLEEYEGYTCLVEDKTLTVSKDGSVLLVVTVDNGGRILSWKYKE